MSCPALPCLCGNSGARDGQGLGGWVPSRGRRGTDEEGMGWGAMSRIWGWARCEVATRVCGPHSRRTLGKRNQTKFKGIVNEPTSPPPTRPSSSQLLLAVCRMRNAPDPHDRRRRLLSPFSPSRVRILSISLLGSLRGALVSPVDEEGMPRGLLRMQGRPTSYIDLRRSRPLPLLPVLALQYNLTPLGLVTGPPCVYNDAAFIRSPRDWRSMIDRLSNSQLLCPSLTGQGGSI
ncbi:hypothetical protein GGR56DRAFT_322635 [Xylariaceae sp. FL0804]|nr:hypothetical protein GGR56DRAFT_322635 [Xylariaceae sp. FL0804]